VLDHIEQTKKNSLVNVQDESSHSKSYAS